jgi:dynein light chain 1
MSTGKDQTTCKQAIQKWQEKQGEENKEDPAEAKHVALMCQTPSIKKMDNSLNQLTACEHLGLSTNAIDRIQPLPGLKQLKILSLSRNNIRRIEKLDELGGTLEELWLSYNLVDRLDGLKNLKKLRVLYMSNNKISNFDELLKLHDLPKLEDLLLINNPIYEEMQAKQARAEVIRRLPKLKKLDNLLISELEREAALNGEDFDASPSEGHEGKTTER